MLNTRKYFKVTMISTEWFVIARAPSKNMYFITMAAVAQKLKAAGEKFGLVSFGEKGEDFDPEIHDALVQNPSPDVTKPQVADVIEPGYKIQDRLLRPAKVAVFLPAE